MLEDKEQLRQEMQKIIEETQRLNQRMQELSEKLDNSVEEDKGIQENRDVYETPMDLKTELDVELDTELVVDLQNTVVSNTVQSTKSVPIVNPYKKNRTTEISKPIKVKEQKEVVQLRESNFEENVGKKVMGVLASLLIFIGLVSFIVLVFGSLDDVIKMSLMYLFSFSLFGIPLWRYRKNNVFLGSLMGCGIGSVYISLIMTSFYFGVMNDIVLLVCLILWSFVVSNVGKRLNLGVFQIIAYMGVGIAIMTALLLGFLTNSLNLLILCFIHIGVGGFFLINLKKFSVGIQNTIRFLNVGLTGILLIFIELTLDFMFLDGMYLFSILLLIGYNLYLLKDYLNLSKLMDSKISRNISVFVYYSTLILLNCFFIALLFSEFNLNFDIDKLAVVIYLILTFVFIEVVKLKDITLLARNLLTGVLLIPLVALYYNCGLETVNVFIGLSFMIIPLLIYKYKAMDKKENIFIYYSFALYFLSLSEHIGYFLNLNYESLLSYIIFICLHIVPLFFIGLELRKEDSPKLKILLYVMINFVILFFSTTFARYSYTGYIETYGINPHTLYYILNDLDGILTYVLMSIFILFVYYSSFCMNWVQDTISELKDKRTVILWRMNMIVSTILLIIGLFWVYFVDYSQLLKCVILLITSLQCYISIKELLCISNKQKGVFVGGVLTTYLTIVLNSYIYGLNVGYLFSILYIVLAVISVLVGFKTEIKSFRLYGLGLSLIGVLKLVLIDITYVNSMSRILSFIGSGLLCFVIVWLYSKMSEKNK